MVSTLLFNQMFKHLNPMYLEGYKDGYEQAKLTMLEKINQMQGLGESTFTVSIKVKEGK